jgi:hypothetical protein
MALDPHFITGFELEMYFVDKDTGLPLSGGIVTFYQDNARTTPKLVYELAGAPPNYTYEPLPNPVILSSVGTIQDMAGNNIALYANPYDAAGNLQLYYVTVTNSMLVPQFTREAWPNEAITNGGDVAIGTLGNTGNKLSNPQFALVNFVPTAPDVITFAGAGTINVPIAPDWILNITSTGAGSVTVTRNTIRGSAAYPFNPPYTLTVTPGANVSALSLTQELFHNPDIWSPQPGGLNGWLASSILLAPGSAVTMQYAPSQGPAQTVLTANNTTGVFTQFNNTVQLAPATNTDFSDVGFVNINLVLSTTNPTQFSNVQVLGIQRNVPVVYDETPVNRQIANMFDYFFSQLQYKPIPSYLVGWDFPLNPAQFLGTTIGAFNTGVNTSNYVWDQTIVFQSVTNSFTTSRGQSGALRLSATANTQLAIIQYIPLPDVTTLQYFDLCSAISCVTNGPAFNASISLWLSSDAVLPSTIAGNISLVASVDANGHPSLLTGNWTEIPRSNLGPAIFPVSNVTFQFNSFSGWRNVGITNAKWLAIVVGTGVISAGNNFSVENISLQKGFIATQPGAKTFDEVLSQCQRYYQMSFAPGQVPASGLGLGNNESYFISGTSFAQSTTNTVSEDWETEMITVPTTFTTYNPAAAGSGIYDVSTATSCVIFAKNVTQRGYYVSFDQDAGAHQSGAYALQWTADSRLGQ